MNFKDQWAEDENGERFVFTVEMQRRLQEAGMPVEPASIVEFKKTHAPPAAPDPNKRNERRNDRREKRQYDDDVTRTEEIEIDPVTGKVIGRLIMFNKRKGFGFITRAMDKIYFHEKNAMDDPNYISQNQKVLYTVNQYRGKDEAIDVEEYEEFE